MKKLIRGRSANKNLFRTKTVKTKRVSKKDSAGWFFDKKGNKVHVLKSAMFHVKGKK
jgi:hypothetical protein